MLSRHLTSTIPVYMHKWFASRMRQNLKVRIWGTARQTDFAKGEKDTMVRFYVPFCTTSGSNNREFHLNSVKLPITGFVQN